MQISESANNDNPYENPNYYNDNGNFRNSSNSNSEDDNPYTNPNYYNDNNQASNNNNNDDNDNNSHVKESNTPSNNTVKETPTKYNYTGKYYWNDRYIQLNSDGSCVVNPSDVGTAGSVTGNCTYSMDLCSNSSACEAQITRIAFYDDGNYAMEGTIDSSNKISFIVGVSPDTGEFDKIIFIK